MRAQHKQGLVIRKLNKILNLIWLGNTDFPSSEMIYPTVWFLSY